MNLSWLWGVCANLKVEEQDPYVEIFEADTIPGLPEEIEACKATVTNIFGARLNLSRPMSSLRSLKLRMTLRALRRLTRASFDHEV